MRTKTIASGIVLVLVLLASAAVGTASALSNSGGGSWAYYKEIIVKENSGKTLTDYQVLVELNSANFDFSKAKSDGSDIRFSLNGEELNYWIEEWNPYAKKAKIWVKVPHIPANGEVKIKMYYGNPDAVSKSNGKLTFLYYESFEEGLSDWNIIGPKESAYTTTETKYHGKYSVCVQDQNIAENPPWGREGIIQSPLLSVDMLRDTRFEFAYKIAKWINDGDVWREFHYIAIVAEHYNKEEKAVYVLAWDDSDQEISEISPHIYYIAKYKDEHNCDPEPVNEWHFHSRSISEDFPYLSLNGMDNFRIEIGLTGNDQEGAKMYVDAIRIRKYTEPEPTLTFSAEYPVVRTALTLRKSVSPYSIKQGQKANVIITVENAGTTTLYDIEVVDTPPAEFEFVSGDTSAKYTALKPGESRTFSYVIKSVSAGKFDLGKAKATYADEEGNYHTVESNAPMIEVLAPLITPEIPSEEKKIPGFEIVSALSVFFAVARMRGRRRK